MTETLRSRGIISSLPAAEVASKDISKLLPGEWLNDEVINFYGVMVNRRGAAAKQRRDDGEAREEDADLLDVHVFSSFFFAKLQGSGYQGVKKWTKKVNIISSKMLWNQNVMIFTPPHAVGKFDLFQKDIIIMPINLGNAHWVCAAINISKKRFEYYDSMGKINYPILEVSPFILL